MKTILLFLLVFSGSPDASPELSQTSRCIIYGQNSSLIQQLRQVTRINTVEGLIAYVNKTSGTTNDTMLAPFAALVVDNFNIRELPSVVEYEVLVQCLAL
jgi:hypothetical protein